MLACFPSQTFCLQTCAEPGRDKKRKQNQAELSPLSKVYTQAGFRLQNKQSTIHVLSYTFYSDKGNVFIGLNFLRFCAPFPMGATIRVWESWQATNFYLLCRSYRIVGQVRNIFAGKDLTDNISDQGRDIITAKEREV